MKAVYRVLAGPSVTVVLWVVVVLQAVALWHWRAAAVVAERAISMRGPVSIEGVDPKQETAVALAELKVREAALRNALWPPRSAPEMGVVPPDRSSAFLDLRHFRQAMDALALSKGVEAGDTAYGFADYTHSGPASEHRVFVHRQRTAAELLLRMLFAEKPARWLGLRREPAPSAGGVASSAGAERVPDTFDAPAPIVASALAGRLCFELRFAGETAVLRRFMNHLLAGPDCIVVRLVEVLPATPVQPSAEVIEAVQREAEFRVVLEWFHPSA